MHLPVLLLALFAASGEQWEGSRRREMMDGWGAGRSCCAVPPGGRWGQHPSLLLMLT